MKFSRKVWSDHETTWLHFRSIPWNRAMPRCAKRGRVCCAFAQQHVLVCSNDELGSCKVTLCSFALNRLAYLVSTLIFRIFFCGHKPPDPHRLMLGRAYGILLKSQPLGTTCTVLCASRLPHLTRDLWSLHRLWEDECWSELFRPC